MLDGLSGEAEVEALIATLGIGREGSTAFALYQIHVTRRGDGSGAAWNVQRRYSDFHTLNAIVEAKVGGYPNSACFTRQI